MQLDTQLVDPLDGPLEEYPTEDPPEDVESDYYFDDYNLDQESECYQSVKHEEKTEVFSHRERFESLDAPENSMTDPVVDSMTDPMVDPMIDLIFEQKTVKRSIPLVPIFNIDPIHKPDKRLKTTPIGFINRYNYEQNNIRSYGRFDIIENYDFRNIINDIYHNMILPKKKYVDPTIITNVFIQNYTNIQPFINSLFTYSIVYGNNDCIRQLASIKNSNKVNITQMCNYLPANILNISLLLYAHDITINSKHINRPLVYQGTVHINEFMIFEAFIEGQFIKIHGPVMLEYLKKYVEMNIPCRDFIVFEKNSYSIYI